MAPINRVVVYANIIDIDSCRHMKELEKHCYSIRFCRNAEDILQLFQQSADKRPDILVTDSLLDHGDGLSDNDTRMGTRTGVMVYNRLRTQFPHLPVIIYTTTRRIFDELVVIDDSCMAVIYERCNSEMTRRIIYAVQRLLQPQ